MKRPGLQAFTVLSRQEYFRQLEEHIHATQKGGRIAVATMSFDPAERQVQVIIKALEQAAARGVKVRCLVDAHSFMLPQGLKPGPLLFTKRLQAPTFQSFSDKLKILEDLKAVGGEYTVTNRPYGKHINPFAGRSHIKFAVIDDDVYMGGCNLKGEDRIDLMVAWKQAETADWLFEFAGRLHEENRVRTVLHDQDQTLTIDSQSSLLIDAGVNNQSLIFENALRVIDEAKDYIVMTCQYPPNGTMARHLSRAVRRGVTVRLVHNHPSKHPFPMNVLHTAVKYFEKHRNPAVLFKYELLKNQDYLHAKLLATERACMIGSHNYVQAGVRFGTAEIALLSARASLAKKAIEALDKQLGTSRR